VGEAAKDVASSAAQHGREVVGATADQVRAVAADLRDRVSERARTQNGRLAEGLRHISDQFGEMATDKPNSPAQTVVQRLSETGRQAADYLERQGPDGMLREVQEFARRRPGAFLLGAVLAGFAVGRLGKSVMGTSSQTQQVYGGTYQTRRPAGDTAYLTQEAGGTAYPAGGTTYPAGGTTYPATGTTYESGSAGGTGYQTRPPAGGVGGGGV
jgi:hypothetical protein